MLTSITASLRRYIWQPSTIIVLALVLAFNVVVEFDWVRTSFPLIEKGQLGFHRILCWTMPRPLTAKWVRTVEISDQNHQINGITDRQFLATLIDHARMAPPEVIVLDFKFQSPMGLGKGEDPGREPQDSALIAAINGAAQDGIPVILPCWLRKVGWREHQRRPDFYKDSDLPLPGSNDQCSLPRNKVPRPACVRIGNINLPNDARQIPLVTPTIDSDSGANSLALAAAAAHDDAIDLSPRTRGKKIIDKAIQDNDFVVGSFIPQSGFQTIAAEKLFQGNQDEIQKCRGRIILIGGDWREASGNGEPVDTYNTPVGPMAGMFIHANYIEALLDDRYQRIVPLPFGLAFDLLVGILLYISFHQAVTARGKLKVLGVFLLPLLASYVIFANFNWYLDFVLPLMACFAHLIFEWVRSYQELRRRAAAHATGGLE